MDEVPILDRARLELITRGKPALADEFLGALFEEVNEILERLTGLAAGSDRRAVRDAAHTIKGMATELGAMRLRAAAAALEAEAEPARWPESVARLYASLAELRTNATS